MSKEKTNFLNLEQEKTIEFVRSVSQKHADELLNNYVAKAKKQRKKAKKRARFLSRMKKKAKDPKNKKDRLKFLRAPVTITQAILQGIPLHEPRRKKIIDRDEVRPYLFEVEDELAKIEGEADLRKKLKFESKKETIEELDLSNLKYIPDKLYLQRLDNDNSKMLVKMFVDWGYLKPNKLSLFLDEEKRQLATCWIRLVDERNSYIDHFPMRHLSDLMIDTEKSAEALFIGQITGLSPNTRYRYRIECYNKENGKLFAGTKFITFKSGFNLEEKNKPLFFTHCSDLHGGQSSGFLRGKVKRRKVRGNQQLKDVYDNIANTESEATFGEGYSLSLASGDLTNNASYSEYWADLFNSCTSLWNHVPLLTSIGNHDYYCSGIGRGQMTGGLEEDCRFFHRYITNPSSGKGILPGHWYSVDQGNVHLVFIDTNGPRWGKYSIDCDSEQWHWLKNDLQEWREKVNKNEKAPQFCVVIFHSAIVSEGYWGSGFNWGNDEKAQSYLLPLFRKYGVDLALFGHDHIYQRSEWQDTQYIVNGRSGGTLRFSQIFAERRTIYDIHRLYSGKQMKTYVTLYIPPNKEHMTDKEKEVFKHFKNVLRNDLLTQPIAHNYFFGIRKINSKIGELIDKDEKLKAAFIDEIILPKLDDHLWLRTYSVEEHFDPRNREIIDLAFIKAKLPNQYQPEKYELLCPGKVID